MANLPLTAARAIRGYEPVFRSILRRWLEAHIDATGNPSLTVDDVSAGVAHTFSAIQAGLKIDIRGEQVDEIEEGSLISIAEARDELRSKASA
jgi:hypothetical protein